MTQTEAKWLMNEYWPNNGLQINANTIKMFTRAINIIKDTDSPVPSCSCQWKTNAQIAKSLYEQNQSLIETKANERKKKSNQKT